MIAGKAFMSIQRLKLTGAGILVFRTSMSLQAAPAALENTDDSEYGKFGWVIDPEGNKVELWQPPAGQ
jgi:hypothetical protein